MKIALVHDYIKEYGGAERVLEALHELYPDAPIYTSLYLPSYLGPHKNRFSQWNIKTSLLQWVPFKQKLISPLRLLTPWAFQQFDFSSYDIIIVSATGAYFPNTIDKKKAVQICYCHTPPRYLYGYATAREWKKNVVGKVVGSLMNHFLRMVDFDASRNVDHYIANSEEVAARIRKFYRTDAVVIYPPVDVDEGKIPMTKAKKEYYLAGGRLARPKHIDLLVKTATEMKIQLKVFGKGFAGYGEELESVAGPSVTFLGEIGEVEKYELMKQAKAFLFAAEDEDFGITPVEAMACGTPVIAYRSGGVQESIIEGKTGVFYDTLTPEALKQAIKQFGKMKFKTEDIRKRAELFSKERFKKEIAKVIEKTQIK